MAMQESLPATTRQVAEAVLLNQRERDKLLAYAYSRFGIDSEDGQDLLQETALELLRQRTYVRNPEAFVFTVFRARCARFIGSRLAARRVFSDGLHALPERAGQPPPAHLDREVALREALGSISSPCRRVLCAYYVEGESLKEAARRLGLAYSSVAKTISRCLKKLRECLGDRPFR